MIYLCFFWNQFLFASTSIPLLASGELRCAILFSYPCSIVTTGSGSLHNQPYTTRNTHTYSPYRALIAVMRPAASPVFRSPTIDWWRSWLVVLGLCAKHITIDWKRTWLHDVPSWLCYSKCHANPGTPRLTCSALLYPAIRHPSSQQSWSQPGECIECQIPEPGVRCKRGPVSPCGRPKGFSE